MYDNTVKIILIILIAAIYLLPSIVAYARDIPKRQTITLFNIIFGWTLIGWIIVFLWAALAETGAEELS